MFDGLKRSVVFGKLASGLEVLRRYLLTGETSGEKVLGWSMVQWKLWAEGALIAAAGGAAGVLLQKLTEWQACMAQVPPAACSFDLKGVGVTAGAAALAALIAWLRQNPTDPRRETPKV